MGTTVDKLNKLLETKQDIKEVIEAKGVTVPSSATFASYATYIGQITTGGGSTIRKYTTDKIHQYRCHQLCYGNR